MKNPEVINLINAAKQYLVFVYPAGIEDGDLTDDIRPAIAQAVERGVTVDLYCCIADYSFHLRPDLQKAVETDRNTGARVQMVEIEVSEPDPQFERILFEFLVADGTTYAHPSSEGGDDDSWSVCTNDSQINAIKRSFTTIEHWISQHDLHPTNKFREPLLLNIPVAAEFASLYCREDHNCAAVHSLWPILRFLKLSPSPERNDEFYRRAFAQIAEEGSTRRILITATCDAAMLAYLFFAFEDQDIEVSVMDQCETPLAVCRWYASAVGKSIHTTSSDIFEYDSGPFDLICTDSFIARFPPAEKPRLLKKMNSLLHPGGRMVTASRLEYQWTEDRTQLDEAVLPRYEANMFRQISDWQQFLPDDPGTLTRNIMDTRREGYNFSARSENEIRSLFTENGFSLEWFAVNTVKDGATNPRTESGRADSDYANIIARKS